MSHPSPVQPFAPRLTRPIQSRQTQPDRLTASQASRHITPRLTTAFTTALRLAHPISITDMKRLAGSITEICQLAAGQSLAATGELVTDGDESRRLRPRGIRRSGTARWRGASAALCMQDNQSVPVAAYWRSFELMLGLTTPV